MVGGVGLRRGRRDPKHLRVGDGLDFWRVEIVEKEKELRLYAEMVLPGKAKIQTGLPAMSPMSKHLTGQHSLLVDQGQYRTDMVETSKKCLQEDLMV